ncbi:MAG: NAD(P)-dependent oxidoreductase [Hyphomicrobiales bacterium]|nr:NAD(P)-dependent oxidoreductase [Hyphomicrobiales bacterium]
MRAIGVIGTGLMGFAVTARLVERGYELHTRDLRPEADAAARAAGAHVHRSPAEVAQVAEAVITLVVDAAQTEEVLFGSDGVVAGMTPGGIVVVSSTIDPADAAEFGRRLAEAGLEVVDAPISGGPARARDGSMSVMVGGSAATRTRLEDVFAAMAARVVAVGEAVGDGSKAKIVNNMIAAANLVAACEGMALADRLGLDPRIVYDVVSASSGDSFMVRTRIGRVVAADETVHAAAHILAKDIGIAAKVAARAGLETPLADRARDAFRVAIDELGLADADDSALIEVYRSAARDGRR